MSDLIIEGDLPRDINGNAKVPGRSPEATIKHIALMANHLGKRYEVPAAQAALAAKALHNLHGFTLGKLERAHGALTTEIISNALANAK
jgi:hypothetical protein